MPLSSPRTPDAAAFGGEGKVAIDRAVGDRKPDDLD